MKKMLCTVLAALLAFVPAICVSRAQADPADAFQPALDTETSC